MMKRHEKLKHMLVTGAQVLVVLGVFGFAFLAIYTDIKNPGSSGMTFGDMMRHAAALKGGTVTAEEIEQARQAFFMLLGAIGTGMAISAVGLFYAVKHPESKLVRFFYDDDWLFGEEKSEKNAAEDSEEQSHD